MWQINNAKVRKYTYDLYSAISLSCLLSVLKWLTRLVSTSVSSSVKVIFYCCVNKLPPLLLNQVWFSIVDLTLGLSRGCSQGVGWSYSHLKHGWAWESAFKQEASVLHSMGLSIGLLQTWQLASHRANNSRKNGESNEDESQKVFYIAILKVI